MSLSAAEKVRVVEALDRLGVHYIEAGFPSSNPKEAELFRLLAGVELENAEICAFGMTRRRGVAAEDDPALRELLECRDAGVHPGRQDLGPAPGQGDQGLARREPGHDHRLGLLPGGARQAGRLRRRALLRRLAGGLRLRARLPAGGGRGGRRERHPLRHERLQPPVAGRRGDRRGGRGPRGRRRGGHPHAQRRRVRGRQLARRGGRRGAPGPGDDERLRRAVRQREPGLDPSGAAAEDGLRVRVARIVCGS